MWQKTKGPLARTEETGQIEQDVRSILSGDHSREPEPRPHYWQNLIVLTNGRIDGVASGKAISLSWVARVALPGAIAILFFFIGLHYYTPEAIRPQVSVSDLVTGFSESSQDSLYAYLVTTGSDPLPASGLYGDSYDPDAVDVEQYVLSSGNTEILIESLSEEQLQDLVSILQSDHTNGRH